MTPAVVIGLVLYTVFSHPTITPQALVSYAAWQLGDLLAAGWTALLAVALEGARAVGVGSLLEVLAGAPVMVAGGVVTYSLVFAIAVRVLYQNLIRNRAVNGRYASVSAS